MPCTVMIVEDEAMMRLWIAGFLKSLPDFRMVAQASNGQGAPDELAILPPST